MASKHNFTSFHLGSGAPLLWRVFAFFVIFIIAASLIGPRIISHGILYTYHFDLYAEAGKPVLFAGIAFGILVSRKPLTEILPWSRLNLVWIGIATVSFACAVYATNQLIDGGHGMWAVLAHLGLIAGVISNLIGCLGWTTLRQMTKAYRRELLLSLGLAVAFYLFLLAVYSLWQVLSAAVLHAVAWLLRLSGLQIETVPPRSLVTDKFGIEVAQYCSGIESIALFTGLYALVGLLDYPRLQFKRYLWIFPLALAVLFACNIVRVYGLIMAGFYINQQLAFSLFHTYAGMVFFILYSGLFWSLMYKRMLRAQI